MANIAMTGILEKMTGKDKDYRYMATSDLLNELNKDNFKADSDLEIKLSNIIIQQLDDVAGDVSGLAVKCLAPLVKKVSEPRVVEMTNKLCEKLLKEKDQHRDIASIAMKAIVAEVSTQSLAQSILVAILPQLIRGITAPGMSTEIKCECLDILCEVLHKFGNLMATDHELLLGALLSQLSSNQASVRKKTVSCIASLASSLSDDLLAKATTEVVQNLRNKGTKSEMTRTNIQMIGALSRAVGYRFGPHLADTVPVLINYCTSASENDEELREYSLQALESFLLRCPRDISSYCDEILHLNLEYLSYDPNFTDNMEEDTDNETLEEEEDDESANEYTDDEDVSWKVRRAAAKCLAALIVSRPEMLAKLYEEACPKLIERFKEREENVKMDIFNTFTELLQQTGNVTKGQIDINEQSPRWLLKQEVPKIVRSINRQLREKSIKTKVGAFSVLKELVVVLPDCLADQIGSLIPGIEKALSDKSSTSNLKIEALIFTRLVLASHSPSVFHPYIKALSSPVLSAVAERYYKVTAEALRVCGELVRVVRPNIEGIGFDFKPYVQPIYKAIMSRLTNQDQDQEVKECAISCMGLLVSTFGDNLNAELPVCLPVLVDRMGNEITRLTAVKAFAVIASSPLWIDLSCVLDQVIAELTAFLRKIVSCSEGASGGVMFEYIACVTVMLTRVNQDLKALSSTPALLEVSGCYETMKQILDYAKTSGLVDQLCLCLATSGASLISGSSNMLRAACEACRAIWLLIESSEFLSTKRNAVSFPLNTMRSPARGQDRGVIWTESAELVAIVTTAIIRSEEVQVAIRYCLHQRLEASLYAGIQLLLKCCLHSAIVPGILCGLPRSVPITTVVSGGGDRTIISEIFSLLSLCISSHNEDRQAIETANLQCKITDPNTLVLHSCLILASVAQCLKATGRNSALFMLTTSSNNQLSRLSVLAHHFSSGECINSSSRTSSASAMLALASILSLESGASVRSYVCEGAVPFIPKTNTLCEYLKLPTNSEIVSGLNALSNWHGLRDGCVGLLEVTLRWGGPSAVEQMCANNVHLLLINLLAKNQQISFPSREEEISATDQGGLSPIGVLWTVSSICQCLSHGAITFRQILLQSDHIKLFYDLICDMHLKLVKSCDGPSGRMDGGCYKDVINATIDLLAVPFVTLLNASQLPSATASVINRILLNMGSPGVKVYMEDRDMVKVIEEDLGKYIKILSEVGVFDMVACSERGTLIGVLPYKEGLVAYSDCRGTTVNPLTKEEKIDDNQEKFSTISSISHIYYQKCGNSQLAKELAEGLAEDVKKVENDTGDFVTIDIVKEMVYRELSYFAKAAPAYLRIGGVGGIFIGWAADKTYQAFDIYATKFVRVVWLKTSADILEANTSVGCSNIAVWYFKAAKDIFVPYKSKETIESGTGAPFVGLILPSMMAGNYEKSQAEVTSIAVKASNHAALHIPDVGGTTKVRVFTHGEPFIPDQCEAYTPAVAQFNDPTFSDRLILIRIHQSVVVCKSTEFEKTMSERKGVTLTSFFFSNNNYKYYRVLTNEDAKIVFAELTSESVEVDGRFFLVDYMLNEVYIRLGVALYTQDLLCSI